MPEAGFQYWTILLIVVLVLGAWAIRRAGNRLRDELNATPGAKGPRLTKEQVDAIRQHGLATPEALFKMSPKEQQLLATMALAMNQSGRGGSTGERGAR